MSNHKNGIVHCTVDHNGRLSLWDSLQKAIAGKESHEVNVDLTLTVHQIRIVLRAAQMAKSRLAEMPVHREHAAYLKQETDPRD